MMNFFKKKKTDESVGEKSPPTSLKSGSRSMSKTLEIVGNPKFAEILNVKDLFETKQAGYLTATEELDSGNIHQHYRGAKFRVRELNVSGTRALVDAADGTKSPRGWITVLDRKGNAMIRETIQQSNDPTWARE